ncbi:MAG TPA: hypothetical protein VER55_09405, partial [Ardenticatenaceae bacterium]|nr:hypothetical protein [Ardenticatenaceae bacterium]
MKRHPALQELSREHHLLLLEARQIRWLRAGDRRAPPLDVVLASFLDTWHSVAVRHIQEEDEVLLPLSARYPSPEQERDAERI